MSHMGYLLKNAREGQRLHQGDLSKLLGLEGPQYISNVERGACVLSAKYWVTLGRILSIEDEEFVRADGEDHMEMQRKKM